jgi:hypothetical protein
MRQEYGWIMSKLVALERRILILEKSQPEPVPWPPKPGTMGHLLYQDLGMPAECIGFMEMYLLAAEQFYEA